MSADSGNMTMSDPWEVRALRRIRSGVNRTFRRLDRWSCLTDNDRREFHCYRGLMTDALDAIGRKVASNQHHLLDLTGFPQVAAFPGYHIKAGLFIGSFDPFQMTHLTLALRFLASPHCDADVVFVVPEGAPAVHKPHRSDYDFRFEVLRLQVGETFSPLIVPLDLGRDADTLEIVRRFIAMFPGAKMSISHLMGTDSLTWASRYSQADRDLWDAQARRDHVKFGYRIFALPRGTVPCDTIPEATGFPVFVDRTSIDTPSSTDLRRRAVFTILFPSSAILRKVEVLFRYSMNHSWDASTAYRDQDYVI